MTSILSIPDDQTNLKLLGGPCTIRDWFKIILFYQLSVVYVTWGKHFKRIECIHSCIMPVSFKYAISRSRKRRIYLLLGCRPSFQASIWKHMVFLIHVDKPNNVVFVVQGNLNPITAYSTRLVFYHIYINKKIFCTIDPNIYIFNRQPFGSSILVVDCFLWIHRLWKIILCAMHHVYHR